MEETIKGIEVIAYKVMKYDMTCSGFQYELGKTYKTDKAKINEYGFHACLNPIDVLDYYLEEGPFNNAEDFAKSIFRTEIRSSGFDPVQDEYDLTDFETQLVYELIYKRVKANLPTLEEATQLALRKKLN